MRPITAAAPKRQELSNSLTVLIAEIHGLDESIEAAEISLTNGKRERAAKVAEMRDHHGLAQRDIATRLGWSLGKVNGVLQFHANPNAAAPFAEQSKAQRERQRNVQPIEHKAATGAEQPKKNATHLEILEVWLRLPEGEAGDIEKRKFFHAIGLKVVREILERLEDEASQPIVQSDWRPSVRVH